MQNFGSQSMNSIDNVNCEYQNFILQQKHLMHKIHSQEKKLRNYQSKNSANPCLMSGSFVKRHNSCSSKYERPKLLSGGGMDKLRCSMQTLCPPHISSELPTQSKNYRGSTCSDNNFNRSELLKTKLKKETLETEIELLENHIKLKRQELRHSCTSLNDEHDIGSSNRLSCSVDNQQFKPACHKAKACIGVMDPKNPFTYDDVLKIMNERDVLRHRLSVDKANKDLERRGMESQMDLVNCEMIKTNKHAADKIMRLEEELESAKKRLEEHATEKDNIVAKCTALENKVVDLQHDLNKKERDGYNQIVAENTEKHLSNLCQTLTSQMEDYKVQLKMSDEKCKRLESEQNAKYDKFDAQNVQIETLKKELERSNETYERLKQSTETLMANHQQKQKEISEINSKLLKDREEECYNLRCQLADAKNVRFNNQELHDALIEDFKKTISKQDDELKGLEEALKMKQLQFEQMQRDFEQSLGPKIDERIRNEKMLWEQEQNFMIRKEICKLNEERGRELARVQEDLNSEKEKYIIEHEKSLRLEKELEVLNHELSIAEKEKAKAVSNTIESFKHEADKIRVDAQLEKIDELNRVKRINKELEDEIQRLKIEQRQNVEKDREFIVTVEKLEKSLIKEINDEQRKLSSIIPGLMPKLVNCSNLRGNYSCKNVENALTLNTFQLAFQNLRSLLDELTKNYQVLRCDNENTRRTISKLEQQKEECIENIKRQYERQKQKELETIREYVHKDKESMSSYSAEVGDLIAALKNKDKEIMDIQENMSGWKKDTLAKLADKFEIELNKELDKRMKEHKIESTNQQNQLDKIRKEMDHLIKEHRQSSANQIGQEQHERMVRYLQSRLNDLRDENLALRDRFKSSNYCGGGLPTKSSNECMDFNVNMSPRSIDESVKTDCNEDESNLLYTPSLDGEDHLESKNELLQQKLNELQKLQMQLNSVKS